ncbi:Ankyrin [Cellulophaga algicola DSM 14237]|uniref:Ankyrin n=1 Tax=Cellulophaga algicola (strain DSM 14237 / IC166 / ACAM 630) TaxID=688270 RepID=E6X6M5_CELAD|nr:MULTISPECIES: ankyrin repeat domain-containing protein [Cellulophaga]ADV49563.1 Ankyrin [Cellulophaga algicola DSM 14237]
MKKSFVIAVLGLTLISTSVKAETSFNSSPETTINIKKITGLSSFCNAILKGDIQTVKSMISLGEDVNEKSLGMTPAIFAARYNRADILELLIENGADIKAKCDKGRGIKRHAELSGAVDALAVIEAHWKKK